MSNRVFKIAARTLVALGGGCAVQNVLDFNPVFFVFNIVAITVLLAADAALARELEREERSIK